MARTTTVDIGFIGAGNMAGAIIRGLLAAKPRRLGRILVADPDAGRVAKLVAEGGVTAARSNRDLCREAGVVILAVKPGQVNTVLHETAAELSGNHLLVSIAAGVNLFQIESRLKARTRLVRVMPNTPLLVGKGMSAVSWGTAVREGDRKLVLEIFGALGRVAEVEEKLMDAVTALSGSGPAYIFMVIEALADGGVAVGLPRQTAVTLAAQTVAGAGEMVLATGMHPGALKDMVTSPGGTTIHGLAALEEHGVRAAFIDAVFAARDRARELAGE